MNKDEKICKNHNCGKIHSVKEIKRVFGKESLVFLMGYCSAQCFTIDGKIIIAPVSVINWIPVKSGQLPIKSEQADKETLSNGFSDKVLVFCSDGNIRMARYHNKIKEWNVDGCLSSFSDFVLYWAINLTEEINKLKLREKLKEADREMDA